MSAPPADPSKVAALRARLPRKVLDLLDGRNGRYSEWATANAIGISVMNLGFTEYEFVAVTMASDFAYYFATEDGGRDRSARLESRLRKVWAKCEDGWEPPLGDVEDVRAKLEQLSQRVDRYAWPARTARTDRAVALALVEWAHEIGVWTLDAGERDVSIRAGLDRKTVRRARGRLAACGLISRDQDTDRDRSDASRWAIHLGWQSGINTQMGPHDLPYGGRGLCGVNSALIHPVFVGSGLGQTAGRVWLDIGEHPDSTAVEIASRLQIGARAVSSVLATRLVHHGLVIQSGAQSGDRGRPTPTFRLNPESPTLDDIAERLDVADWHRRAVDRYDRERGGFREVQRQKGQRERAASADAELAEVAEQRRREEDQHLRDQMGIT